jgi:hypothetical protein
MAFVDNTLQQIRSVQKLCPHIHTFHAPKA